MADHEDQIGADYALLGIYESIQLILQNRPVVTDLATADVQTLKHFAFAGHIHLELWLDSKAFEGVQGLEIQ